MGDVPLAGEAVHEAGHAVMARYLGLGLERIWISRAEGSGKTCVLWPDGMNQKKDLLILAAARGCMRAFGIDTLADQGSFRDVAQISTTLTEMFPTEDEAALYCRIADLDAKVKDSSSAAMFFLRHWPWLKS